MCPANPGPRHQRKFFQVGHAHWLAHPGAPIETGALSFWGSWEQATRYRTLPASRNKADANAVHQPVLSGRASRQHGDQTQALPTHPFVFDAPFLFLPGKDSPNRVLSRLDIGDIVAFGSHLQGEFALDTVFVVNGRQPVGDASLSALFRRVNQACFDSPTLPVYRGASLDQPLPPFMPAKRVQFLFTGSQHIADRQNSLAKCGSNVPCQGTGIKENARPSSVKTLQARKDLRPLLPQKIVSRYPRPRRLAQKHRFRQVSRKREFHPLPGQKSALPIRFRKNQAASGLPFGL